MPNPFYEGLSAVVQSVVLSPHLLFKPELVPGGFDAAERGRAAALGHDEPVPLGEQRPGVVGRALVVGVAREQAQAAVAGRAARRPDPGRGARS